MKVLVIGSGGREHTLCWKIAQSQKVDKIYAAPGNGGMAGIAQCVDIKADDLGGLLDFGRGHAIDLTVVGPEAPLVAGIVDKFERAGLRIFGPRKELAQLEGSKVFAKETVKRFNVPTAEFEVFEDAEEAKRFVREKGAPIVVKADGLAAGKGVIVAKTVDEALSSIKEIMEDKIFGQSGNKVIIEDCLVGEEASIIVLSDGENVIPLASSQDHKRIFDGDAGPNTGGMGAYSPAPVVEGRVFDECIKKIINPIIKGLAKEGRPYKGVLYAGIMLTDEGPKVLEFNVRFGDPETQAILPRLKSDLVDLMERSIDGKLKGVNLNWDGRSCVCVVAASGGYPGKYEKGKTIFGLEEAARLKDIVIFHAGTKLNDSKILTDGGRVLGVTALGDGIDEAIKRVYEAIGKIHFENMYYRRDIGHRAMARLMNTKRS